MNIEQVASLVKHKLPQYILEDYETFVEFISYFYKFLEIYGNPRDLLRNSRSYLDIDNTLDELLPNFKKFLASDLPLSIAANEKLVIKHINDLYDKKGTEAGLRLFFKILFNESVNVKYPSESMLRVSDGRWTESKTIFIKLSDSSTTLIDGNQITGLSSKTIANLETVEKVLNSGTYYYKCVVSIENGLVFEVDEVIKYSGVNIGTIFNIVIGIQIGEKGHGYLVGDIITIGSSQFRIITVSEIGEILEVKQIYIGLFKDTALQDIKSIGQYQFSDEPFGGKLIEQIRYITHTGTGATVTPIYGAINSLGGSYIGQYGLISGGCKIQDSDYYQVFSYDIESKNSRDIWQDSYNKIIHPIGNKLFSTYILEDINRLSAMQSITDLKTNSTIIDGGSSSSSGNLFNGGSSLTNPLSVIIDGGFSI